MKKQTHTLQAAQAESKKDAAKMPVPKGEENW